MSPDTPAPSPGPVIRTADLAKGESRALTITPEAPAREAIAAALGISAVKKLRFDGVLAPLGKRDWQLTGTLGATVVQPCVVTLAPVTTRIDEPVTRRWLADWQEPTGDEVELPDEVDSDPLGPEIDIGAVLVEALALALPAFPRAEGAELGEAVYTRPGEAAMTDADARPFAGLAGLRGKLSGDGADD
jgi:uncharacterized metal-binding protein YceD (DUF177 family)